MDRCGKCGCEVPAGTGRIKRIDVGSVDGKIVFADRLVCNACAATIENGEKGCMLVAALIAAFVGIVWAAFFIYDFFIGLP